MKILQKFDSFFFFFYSTVDHILFKTRSEFSMNSRIFLYPHRRIIFAVIFLYNPSRSHFHPDDFSVLFIAYTRKLRLAKQKPDRGIINIPTCLLCSRACRNCCTILFSFLKLDARREPSGSVINSGEAISTNVTIFSFFQTKELRNDIRPRNNRIKLL